MNAPQNQITSTEARVLVEMLNRTWLPGNHYEEAETGIKKLIQIANEKTQEERK